MKFRIWNKHTNSFCENDDYNSWLLDMHGEPHHIQGGTHDHLEDDNYVIQLSTGIKDVYGQEIYEGDLVNDLTSFFCPDAATNSFVMKERETNPLEVYWCQGEAQFRMKNDKHEYHDSIVGRRIAVIGNILENQELVGKVSTL